MNEEKSFDFPEFLTFIAREFNRKKIEFDLNKDGLKDKLKKEFDETSLNGRAMHHSYSRLLQSVDLNLNDNNEYNELVMS